MNKKYHSLHARAMLDVISISDENLEYLVSLGFKRLLLGHVEFTEKKSYYDE